LNCIEQIQKEELAALKCMPAYIFPKKNSTFNDIIYLYKCCHKKVTHLYFLFKSYFESSKRCKFINDDIG